MDSTPPPGPSSRPPRGKVQRPWYLIVALVLAWLLGASGLVSGCEIISVYKAEAEGLQAEPDSVDSQNDTLPPAAKEQLDHLVSTWDAARGREFPLAVAMLLLGGALVALSARAMAGREGARGLLVQVTTVNAMVLLLAYVLTRDVRAAESLFWAAAGERGRSLLRPLVLGAQTLCSALIVVALTRQRSRAFFRSMEGRFSER